MLTIWLGKTFWWHYCIVLTESPFTESCWVSSIAMGYSGVQYTLWVLNSSDVDGMSLSTTQNTRFRWLRKTQTVRLRPIHIEGGKNQNAALCFGTQGNRQPGADGKSQCGGGCEIFVGAGLDVKAANQDVVRGGCADWRLVGGLYTPDFTKVHLNRSVFRAKRDADVASTTTGIVGLFSVFHPFWRPFGDV